jgi:molybdenum cofactor synthesis domain-containing protein
MARTARVITASTRAAQGVRADTAGPALAETLRGLGLTVDGIVVVPDGDPVERAMRMAVADQIELVLTTGGTGCTPTDRTPDVTRRVVDREIPGIGELIRADGLARGVRTAVLSRGTAGVAGATVVINLPGSPRGAAEGLAAVADILGHLLDQVAGGDHAPAAPTVSATSRPLDG